MSRLKALFNKGLMKLTKGHQLMWVSQNEIVMSESDLKKFVNDFAMDRVKVATDRIKELEEMSQRAHGLGYEKGLKASSAYTLLLPVAIGEENKHLVDIVGLIAGELLEQGDSESCAWLFKKIHQCRSL